MTPRRLTLVALAAVILGGGLACRTAGALPYTDPAIMLTLTPDQELSIFGNLPKLFPVAHVKRGRSVSPLPMAAPQIAPDVTWNGQTFATDDFMAAAHLTGILVISLLARDDGQCL
jgi:hypothetical protein